MTRSASGLLPALLMLAACASPAASPAPAALAAPTSPSTPPPAAAARKELPPGVTEAETHRAPTRNGTFVVWWTSDPSPIPFNAPFTLRVWAASAGAPDVPLKDASLELAAQMPEHGHGMSRSPRVTPQPDGSVLVEGMLFHMRGHWELLVNVRAAGVFGQAALPVYLQ
jgi:hypothetical protein